MKFAHIADIHIRNNQYHDNFRYTFNNLYVSLEKNKPDHIVLAGDLIHTKNQISPELVELLNEFLGRLSTIAPVHIILGNHDCNIRNRNNKSVIEVLNEIKKEYDFKIYNEFDIVDLDSYFQFVTIPCFYDKNQIKDFLSGIKPSPSKTTIGLYHGIINKALLEGSFQFGDETFLNIEDFSNLDFVFLGDIHRQQFLNKRIAYAGSLLQNNFAEEPDKGYLLWDIESRDRFSVNNISIESKQNFYTLSLNGYLIDSGYKIRPGSKIRVTTSDDIDDCKKREIEEEIYNKYRCTEVFWQLLDTGVQTYRLKATATQINFENIRGIEKQVELIGDYVLQKGFNDFDKDNLIRLHKEICACLNIDDFGGDFIWDLKSLSFNNLFNYGGNNHIDFSKLSGLIGVLGNNRQGKSSIFDSISFGIFGGVIRNISKLFEIINRQVAPSVATSEVVLGRGGDVYQVKRAIEKVKQVSKKKEKFVSKGELEIKKNGLTIVDDDKIKTEQLIKTLFGEKEDFLLTTVFTSEGDNNIISTKASKRIDRLFRYFSLDFFEQFLFYANKAKNEIDAEIKYLNKTLLDAESIHRYKELIIDKTLELEGLKKSKEELDEYLYKYSGASQEIINKYKDAHKKVCELQIELDGWDDDKIKECREDLLNIEKATKKVYNKENEIKQLEKIKEYKIPCGQELYRDCPLYKEFYWDRGDYKTIKSEHAILKERLNELIKKKHVVEKYDMFQNAKQALELLPDLSDINIGDIVDKRKESNKQLKNIEVISKEINNYTTAIETNQTSKDILEKKNATKSILDKYCSMVHRDGLPFELLIRLLGSVEATVNNYLMQVIDFRLKIEVDEETRDIIFFIHEPHKHNSPLREVELASGMEKTIMELILRVAMLQLSQIPKPNFIIIDEKFGALDNESFDTLVKLLHFLKRYFKQIFIVSHNNSFKDVVDEILIIEKDKNGYARINQ